MAVLARTPVVPVLVALAGVGVGVVLREGDVIVGVDQRGRDHAVGAGDARRRRGLRLAGAADAGDLARGVHEDLAVAVDRAGHEHRAEDSFDASPALTSQVPLAIGGIAVGHTTWAPLVLVQSLSQPSPDTVLPSSHCSVPSTFPSPQTLAVSFWHVEEQPSPDVVLLSSHCSPVSTVPLPHVPTSV